MHAHVYKCRSWYGSKARSLGRKACRGKLCCTTARAFRGVQGPERGEWRRRDGVDQGIGAPRLRSARSRELEAQSDSSCGLPRYVPQAACQDRYILDRPSLRAKGILGTLAPLRVTLREVWVPRCPLAAKTKHCGRGQWASLCKATVRTVQLSSPGPPISISTS